MGALDNARYGVAAGAVGIVKACLEDSISYGKERVAFGKPIVEFQLVQQMIANMQQSIDIKYDFLEDKINNLEEELKVKTADRFRSEDFDNWLKLFEATNPELDIPKITKR